MTDAAAHILIVEDDENLRLALADNLVDEGYRVTAVATGRAAQAVLERGTVDLVVLDIMLPDTDGYAICRSLRERALPVRVLMLTARTLEADLVEGFEAGADDYLAKPYRLRELIARIGALLRRPLAPPSSEPEILRFAGFSLDLSARRLSDAAGREIVLTRTEFELLACLLRNAHRAMTREELLKRAWDPTVVVELRTVDNFVSSLKKKLGWSEDAGYRIKTVRGVGYRMEID
jgi:DNA-binding response OmpR family regulator